MSATIVFGSFGRGLHTERYEVLSDEQVARRIFAMDSEKDLDGVMDDIVDCGLESVVFDALCRAMDRREAK